MDKSLGNNLMENVKVICYGVRPNEVSYFHKLNQAHFQLTLLEDLLNDKNAVTAKHHEAIILRGNCLADRKNIAIFAAYGIKYLFTRTVGINHIDLQAAADYGLKVAFVPSYSPNAIAELSLTLAMMLLRHTAYTTHKTSKYNFTIDETMFSQEIRNCQVGVIGTGKIGLTEAKLYKGLGAKVIGYDLFPQEEAADILTYKPLDDLLAECEVISLHIPYLAGQNDHFIDAAFLTKMKKGAILINTARGELQDNAAILQALQSHHLAGFATDVFANETQLFGKKFSKLLPDKTIQALVDLYPRVLVTPHIGANTDEALCNMIKTSFHNLHSALTTGIIPNEITLPQPYKG